MVHITKTVSLVLLNIVFSDTLLIVSRIICSEYGLPNLMLSCFYCFSVLLGLVVCDQFKLFEPKQIPVVRMLPAVMTFSAFVAFSNLSLQRNSIGTHLTVKSLSLQFMLVIEHILHKRKATWTTIIVTIAVTVGILFSNIYDLQIDVKGLLLAIAGFSMMSFYHCTHREAYFQTHYVAKIKARFNQRWVHAFASEVKASPLQLLFQLMPLCALLLLIAALLFEPNSVGILFDVLESSPKNFFFCQAGQCAALSSRGSWSEIWYFSGKRIYVVVAGVLCFLLNLTTLWILLETSLETYGIIGNLKTCALSLFGLLLYLIFRTETFPSSHNARMFSDIFTCIEEGPNITSVLGLIVALAGIGAYFRMKSKKETKWDGPIEENS